VRVGDKLQEALVSMSYNSSLFGAVKGTAGTEWIDPNAQTGGGN
jgi:hypothetical protein